MELRRAYPIEVAPSDADTDRGSQALHLPPVERYEPLEGKRVVIAIEGLADDFRGRYRIAVDKLSIEWKIEISRVKYKSLIGEGKFNDQKIILVKPLTFMNKSGNSVRSFLNFYKIEPSRILIIHDDMDLPFGSLRIRESGGSAGQRGMQSIISRIGTNVFARLRIGIGEKTQKGPLKKAVLSALLPTINGSKSYDSSESR